MTALLIVVILVLAAAVVVLGIVEIRRRPTTVPASGSRRILFPYVAEALSPRALDAALRLARAEGATLVPVFLARVSLDLPLDAPIPRQCSSAIPLQEAIEQRASAFGVAVDERIERGRSYRHALRATITHERFDRIVVAAAANESPGFHADDVAWLLDAAPGEIVVLRPDENGAPAPTAGANHGYGMGALR